MRRAVDVLTWLVVTCAVYAVLFRAIFEGENE